jgi:hypothetical protein
MFIGYWRCLIKCLVMVKFMEEKVLSETIHIILYAFVS